MSDRATPPAGLRRIVALARPQAGRLALGTVFLALGSAAGLAIPQAVRVLLDTAVDAGDRGSIDQMAIAMAVVLAVQAVAVGLRHILFTTAGERVVTDLRRQLFDALLRQEIAFFDGRRTGELVSRLASDTATVQNAVSVNISEALRAVTMVAAGIALLAWTSPGLTLLMLAVVPPVAIGAVVWGRSIRRLARRSQDALADAGEVAAESLGGIRTVRAFAAEQGESRRYAAAVERSFDLAKQRIRLSGLFFGASSLAGFGAAVAVLWYGGRLVLDKAMTVGELSAFLLYTLFVAMAFGTLSGLWAEFSRALGAATRIFELLDRQPSMPAGGEPVRKRPEQVSLRGVRFAYPSRPDDAVLRGVDVEVSRGEVVALVGPSGAGKSTIAALVSRLYDPDEGAVLFDGVDVRTLDADQVRRQVGVVRQEPMLFSTTITENIRYGRPTATDDEVEDAARAAFADGFVRGFPDDYATHVGERGVQLSGGQKQRVAIARALLQDPAVLVLDEATSALDAESEHRVQAALERLMKGRITLVIAHRLSTVKDADRVVVLDEGRIVQQGTHEDLLATGGLYRDLVERQFVAA